MDLLDAARKEGFSFIWTIQNYNLCFRKNKDVRYESPKFELDESSNEKWSIAISPKRKFLHDDIEFQLQRSTRSKVRDIGLEISISNDKDSFQKILIENPIYTFELIHSQLEDPLHLILNKELLETYPENDSLTILVRLLWHGIETRQCYARTIFDTERIVCPCTLEGFEGIEKGTKIDKSIIIFSEFPLFKMSFSLTEETYADGKIEIKIIPIHPNNEFYSTCEIFLIDANGQIAYSVRDECNFEIETSGLEQVRTFSFIQMNKLLRNEKLYLQNGVLHLICEFVVSSGVTSNKVEKTVCGLEKLPLPWCSEQTPVSDSSESLKDNLEKFYAEGNFSDVTIQTPDKKFQVHKTILCARSKVFSAMFQRDMKESQTGIVEIEDVDDDTVSKLLLFLYTDTIGEDLEFETASSLYSAADKYGIVALKRKCVDFLRANFTVTNVCHVLVLADMHQDEELKSAAQNFIFEQSEEIVNSVEWKNLMQTHLQLASETMLLFMQTFKTLNL